MLITERLIMKRQALVLVICFLAMLVVSTTQAEDPAIFWDEDGNVHLFTNSEAELNFAWGWAQMRDNTQVLLNAIETRRQSSSVMASETDEANYQYFADGMTGFLNRRLETISPTYQALLPLQANDVVALKDAALGEWIDIYLHQNGFQGVGTSSLGYPQIVVDKKVEAVDRAVLMEDFRMLELLLPLN